MLSEGWQRAGLPPGRAWADLCRGRKGAGRNAIAIKYEIASIEEARAYWRHPILGARLNECVELVLAINGKTAFQMFGTPEDLKFRSSMMEPDAVTRVLGSTL